MHKYEYYRKMIKGKKMMKMGDMNHRMMDYDEAILSDSTGKKLSKNTIGMKY